MLNVIKKAGYICQIIILFLYLFGIDAHILVYRADIHQLFEEFNDLPAQFGGDLPSNGLHVIPKIAKPVNACIEIAPAPSDPAGRYVAIIERGGENCSFELKVRHAQNASFHAVIIYNNINDDLEQMSANNPDGISIPAVFIGKTSGGHLKTISHENVYLIINDELPFNINTQLILPFSILIGICFFIMICYMVYKCIREERRLQRHRLPKRLLKKIPIIKFTKNYELGYDMCVICLDEFVEGDKLRILPCRHPYHTHCIDPWLTENRRNCPICKRKVFTKGEARSNRQRQSSMDSVTDTDDDTTPLLQQSATATATAATSARTTGNLRNNHSAAANALYRNLANIERERERRQRPRRAPTTANNANHGTFNRTMNGNTSNASAADNNSSDDENLLLAPDTTAQSASQQRRNPFNRSNDVTINVALQSNTRTQNRFFSLPIFRIFRRNPPLSVAAPPYLQEVLTANDADAIAVASSLHTNILNGLINHNDDTDDDDDDEEEDVNALPHQSIYEPIAGVAASTLVNGTHENANDSVFMVMPATENGIGVCALPNQSNPII